jgi:hypothetical protein
MNKNDAEPKLIKEKIYLNLDLSEILKGSFKEVAKNILAIKDKIDPTVKKKYKDFEMEYDQPYYEESYEIIVYGIRTETPEELAFRLAYNEKQNQLQKLRARKSKKSREENEFKLYQKLHKKYGV